MQDDGELMRGGHKKGGGGGRGAMQFSATENRLQSNLLLEYYSHHYRLGKC
jgi:hypothetical protein